MSRRQHRAGRPLPVPQMLSDNRIFELGQDDRAAILELIRSFEGDFNIPSFDVDPAAFAPVAVTVPEMRPAVAIDALWPPPPPPVRRTR